MKAPPLYIATGVLILLANALVVAAEEPQMKTYTYKQVGDLAIKADVHTSGDSDSRPVVVAIHGGALIMGYHAQVDERLKVAFLKHGYAFVSIDYRLAPETQLPEIIHD